jgi:hypothetical protein
MTYTLLVDCFEHFKYKYNKSFSRLQNHFPKISFPTLIFEVLQRYFLTGPISSATFIL